MVLTVVGILLFVVILLLSVSVHEFGHLLTAKAYGMKATEYFVGFGPRLWSFRRGETEYGFKAIPAGGYVKIVGMSDLEQVPEADDQRAFYRYPAVKKLVVLSAGSVSHFVIGFVLFLFVLMALGRATAVPTVDAVAECIPADNAAAAAGCRPGDPPSPARAAGFAPGDRVVAVGGTAIEDWPEAAEAIRAAGPGPVDIAVERDGRRVVLAPTLVPRQRAALDGEGTETVGVLGISPDIAMERDGPVQAAASSGELVGRTVKLTGQVLVDIPSRIPELVDALNGQDRDEEGLVGIVGIARISGETLSGQQTPLSARAGSLLIQMAALNVFIGIFNALPLLPLDGGHMAVVSFESLRARLYRLFGKADPGRVDMTRLLPVAYFFLLVLIGLTVLLLAADIVNPISLNS